MSSEDIPLTDAFYQNPLEYMQLYVRNLNNQIFLSEYHINNLYALLLIGRNTPWDNIKGNSITIKEEIDVVVNQKVQDVKSILQSLSNVYEDKAKKCAINQIQKLMSILKSKKKSIFIEKDKATIDIQNFQLINQIAKMEGNQKYKEETEQIQVKNKQIEHSQQIEKKSQKQSEKKYQQEQQHPININIQNKQSQPQQQIQIVQSKINQSQQQIKLQVHKEKNASSKPSNEVFSIFYGLANIANLSALALTNILEYNSAERFIKFKMSQNYNMTIKNEDPLYYDKTSRVSALSSDIFVNHVFPYLTASQLFSARSVCKQWLDNVKQAWHSTFKRQMFVQLLACQFCKDIQFFYKTIQLRNPFFQKLSLLLHALIQIIQWDNVYQSIQSNNLTLQSKRILILILRLTGQKIPLTNLNAINDEFFNLYKDRLLNLKQRVTIFFSTLSGSDMSVNDLRILKTQFLDDPFMRVQEINTQDKSPLLLTLFAKQMTLQQILRNHIFLCQQYLLNTKKRLDSVSKKMVYQKGYLEGVYKILLLKSSVEPLSQDRQQAEMPNFHQMLQSIFTNRNSNKPDFVIRNKSTSTEIFLDNATKLDLILTTFYNLEGGKGLDILNHHHHHNHSHNHQCQAVNEKCEKKEDINEQNKKQSKNQIINSIDIKIDSKGQNSSEPEEQK